MAFNFTSKNNHAWIIVTEKNGFTYISTGIKYIYFMARVEYFGVAYVKIFLPVLLKMNGFDGYDIIIHRDYHQNMLCYENFSFPFFLSSQTFLGKC
jgi:hypothetical protein